MAVYQTNEGCPKAYGCVFCLTGHETDVARRIADANPTVKTIVPQREKPRYIEGRYTIERDLLMPGYVFFEADETLNPFVCFRMEAVIRVLPVGQHTWQLAGRDREFVRWLFVRDGLLEISKAYRENDQIRIISGPLKDMEGAICRVNRHNKRGQVKLDFDGRTFKVWLNFDLVEPKKSESP